MASHHAQRGGIERSHRVQSDQRHPQATKSHRRGVGNQAQDRGLQRGEPQPDQNGTANRHRGTGPRRPLKKGPKTKSDQHGLEPHIRRNAANRGAHQIKRTALDGQVVEQHATNNGVTNGQHAEQRAMGERQAGKISRHTPKKNR